MSGLIIFIKNPELGKCKTRLAATIGDVKALSVYLKLLDHTRDVAQDLPINKYLFYNDHVNSDDAWPNNIFIKSKQSNGDLGNRMSEAFKIVLQHETKAIIIGSDCPEINQTVIKNAFEALNQTDFVIGPTFDGGYYLLGMKQNSSFLFENMTWSVDTVFNETLARIKAHSKSYTVLDYKSDLDNEHDLNRFPNFKV